MEENKFKISERLAQIAKYLPKGAVFADIGSDHAYLPCYVCSNDETAKAIAGEVNEGPLNSARKNVVKHGLEDKVKVRLGDGLEVLKDTDEVKQIVIAGMGGGLIQTILENGKDKLDGVERIITQPNINASKVRYWLNKHGFHLSDEYILEENGHIYEILIADKNTKSPYNSTESEKQFFFGPHLLQKATSVFYKKWNDEKSKVQAVIAQLKQAEQPDEMKLKRFEKELAWIEEVLADDINEQRDI